MKKEHLFVLAGLLVVLLLVRLLMGRGGETVVADLDEAGLALVLPEGFEPESLARLRVQGPAESGKELLVEKSPEGGWVVTSAHGAAADAEAIEDLVSSLAKARGELRGEGEGLWAEFGVDDAQAARLELGTAEDPVAAVLFLGKAGDTPEACFVRSAGSEAIRHLAKGPLVGLGLRGEARDPAPDQWVQKQVLDLAAESIARIEVSRPDLSWVFEQQLAEAADALPPESATEPVKREWTVSAPALPWPAREWGASGLAGRVARLRVNSVLDPSDAACSFGESGASMRVVMDSGEEHRLELGTTMTATDELALRLDGGSICYGLSKWTAQSLLPKAGQVFEAPRPFGDEAPEAEAFQSLTIERGGQTIRLARDGEDWTLEAPEQGPADAARAGRIVSSLRYLNVEDVAVADGVPEASRQVEATVTARVGDARWKIQLLGERVGTASGERYVLLEGGEGAPEGHLATVAKTTVEGLLATLDELRSGDTES